MNVAKHISIVIAMSNKEMIDHYRLKQLRAVHSQTRKDLDDAIAKAARFERILDNFVDALGGDKLHGTHEGGFMPWVSAMALARELMEAAK